MTTPLCLLAALLSPVWAGSSAYTPAIRTALALRAGPSAPSAINALHQFRADATPEFIDRVLAPIAVRLEAAGVSPENVPADVLEAAVAAESAAARRKAGKVLADVAHEITNRKRLAQGAATADELARVGYAYFDKDELGRLWSASESMDRQSKLPLYREKLSDARREMRQFLMGNPFWPADEGREPVPGDGPERVPARIDSPNQELQRAVILIRRIARAPAARARTGMTGADGKALSWTSLQARLSALGAVPSLEALDPLLDDLRALSHWYARKLRGSRVDESSQKLRLAQVEKILAMVAEAATRTGADAPLSGEQLTLGWKAHEQLVFLDERSKPLGWPGREALQEATSELAFVLGGQRTRGAIAGSLGKLRPILEVFLADHSGAERAVNAALEALRLLEAAARRPGQEA